MRTYKYIMTCILALVSFLPMQAQTVDKEAMYIYQKDGNVNIFFRNEVTSISIELKDGELYQVVKTGERQHAFPISNIQSVSFVHPVEDTYKPTILEDEDTPTFGKFVDLGLPSGTMWASFNVGASTPEEYGGYYAWGETEEKDVYNDDTYKYYRYGSYVSLGYDFSGTEYDVAHVKWNGRWCMPTREQQMELVENCSYKWITYHGVKGALFTGSNGNRIFLPAAGGVFHENLCYAGDEGFYWSSTQHIPSYPQDASLLNVHSNWANTNIIFYRGSGYCVRPVCLGLQISSHEVDLKVGNSKNVDIIRGSGYYIIDSNDTEVATATINENAIVINALNVGEATITVMDTQLESTAYITVKVNSNVPSDVPEAIDLGLPSGTKWASCNVGATKPEEYGGHYSWGETEENEIYQGGLYSDISGTEYDIAHVKWGGNWVMPTRSDFIELINNCEYEWITFNGVNGMKFTSKKNSNNIFLPAAGLSSYGVGEAGYYWSSVLDSSDSRYARVLIFYSDEARLNSSYNINSHLSVRPVLK